MIHPLIRRGLVATGFGIAAALFLGCTSLPSGVATDSVTTYTPSELQTGSDHVVMVPALPDAGFQTEYYLYVPTDVPRAHPSIPHGVRLLVKPNNTGRVDDHHAVHRERARQDVERGWARHLAEALRVPVLVPTFDRPASIGSTYTHALDRDTMEISIGRYARIDRQLVAMIDHARTILEAADIPTDEQIWMVGFSASANFTNRFAVLHPERVRAVATGGVNGMPIIPSERWNGYDLPYHVGTGDVERFVGHPFDINRYRSVSQYIFMGQLDRNDTLPFGDAYSEAERRITREVLGESMAERWDRSREIYRTLEIPAQFVTYREIGHEMNSAVFADIAAFLRANDTPGFTEISPSWPTVDGLAD